VADVFANIGYYVEDPEDYVETGYFLLGGVQPSSTVTVNAQIGIAGIAPINSASSVTASAERTRTTSIPIAINTTVDANARGINIFASSLGYGLEDGTAYTWDNVGSTGDWDNWPDNVWGDFSGLHIPITTRSTITGGRVKTGNVTISLGTVTVNVGTRQRPGTATIAIASSTATAAGTQIRGRTSTIANTTTTSTTSTRQRTNDSTLAIATTVTPADNRTRNSASTITTTTTTAFTGNVVFTSDTTVQASSILATTGRARLAGVSTINLATVNITTGTVYQPDPYRTHRVESSTRTIRVSNIDDRTVAMDSETRTIMVLSDDNRTYATTSETRQYKLPVPPLVARRQRINQ